MVLIDLEQYEQITFPDLNILQNSVEEVLVAFRCLKELLYRTDNNNKLLNELSGEFNKLIYERARESLKMSIIDDLLQTLTLLEDMAKNRERDLDKLETNFTDFINSLSSTSSRVQEQHDRNHLEYQTEIFQKVFNSSLDFIKYNQLKHERLITNKIKKYKKVSTAAKSTTELTEHHIKEDSKEITSDIISSYQLSPEACERLVTRFKNVIIEIQKKPKYQQAIKDLINVIPQITEKSSEFATHITQHIVVVGSSSTNDQQKRGSTPSMSSSAVEQNTKDVESFADNRSLYPLISTLNDFGQKIKHDEDLREFLKDLEHFILSSLLEPEFVKKTDYIQQGSGVINKGRKLLLGHYCELTQTIVGEVQEFNKAMMEDKATMELKRDVDILIEDLFLNEIGQFTFKFQLVKDFSIILPRLAKRLEYIPLPEYEYSDENIEFNADNIVLHVQHELFPKHINIGLNAEIGLNRPEENRKKGFFRFED
ncbi:10930_t:CDS:2, partial [Entrophospora sp. SA101]